VTATYGVSIAYLVGDVGYEGYKASLRAKEFCPERQNEIVGLGVAKRGKHLPARPCPQASTSRN